MAMLAKVYGVCEVCLDEGVMLPLEPQDTTYLVCTWCKEVHVHYTAKCASVEATPSPITTPSTACSSSLLLRREVG